MDLDFQITSPMRMACENQATICICSDFVCYERNKHIEVDCNFIRDMVMKKQMAATYVKSEDQLGNLFTKALARAYFSVTSWACWTYMLQFDKCLE